MKQYKRSTLMRMTKEQLVEYIRCLEHNEEAAKETLEQVCKNVVGWTPVVRCKDCNYSEKAFPKRNCDLLKCCKSVDFLQPDDFCSNGERKGGGE